MATFLTIPVELRSRIYCGILEDCVDHSLPLPYDDLPVAGGSNRFQPYLNLVRANRQVHDELQSCLFKWYSHRILLLCHHSGASGFTKALRSCPKPIRDHARFQLRCPAEACRFHWAEDPDEELKLTEHFMVAQPVFTPNSWSLEFAKRYRPRNRVYCSDGIVDAEHRPGRKHCVTCRLASDTYPPQDPQDKYEGSLELLACMWSTWKVAGANERDEDLSIEAPINDFALIWSCGFQYHGCWILKGFIRDLKILEDYYNSLSVEVRAAMDDDTCH